MMKLPGAIVLCMLLGSATSARGDEPSPYALAPDAAASQPAPTPLDELVLARLRAANITPAPPCSDAVFVRRVYLDVLGILPEPNDVQRFLADPRPDKRAVLIDTLLVRPEFADYWTQKWCDLLRVKAEYPINLWPNAVQAYSRWIHDAVRQNWPYDRFARALLTSSGSNFRDAPANFYRAVQGRTPADLAAAAALTFMGVRVERWPTARRDALAVFFAQVGYKKTTEWKEEIVLWQPGLKKPQPATLPDGTTVRITPDDDPRQLFANWLIRPENPYFTRNIVNRVWAWLLGRGIIHEPDDLRPDNPPTNPELLAYLEAELVGAQYDLRHIFRLILMSRTYEQAATPRSTDPAAESLFAVYPVRRLEAEVLADALCWLGGTGEQYSSPIPEPFTYIPEDERSVELTDGSITSPFLEMFGRPARDTGLESERNNQPNDAQRLHLLNSNDVLRKVERSPRLAQVLSRARGKPLEIIRGTYLTILSRYPTDAEASRALAYFGDAGTNVKAAATDLAWALVNSKEFLYRH
jgi:hypothetical protein